MSLKYATKHKGISSLHLENLLLFMLITSRQRLLRKDK